MEQIAPQIDIETEINDRRKRHICLMKDLDGVMDVLGSFTRQAEWMMKHDYRIGELIGEVVVASTEVEHILPRTEQYFVDYQNMLLPAIDRQKPKSFDDIIYNVKAIIHQLKPYCDKIMEDEEKLNLSRIGEIELTGEINNKFIAYYKNVIDNFSISIDKLERHINESEKKHSNIPDDSIKMRFENMYKQYYTAKQQDLNEFIEDIEDIRAAKRDFIATNQSNLLNIFQQNEKHPELIISILRNKRETEIALISIFYYKSRLDVLKGLKTAAKNKEKVAADKVQPENIVFRKFHEGKQIDFFTIKKAIELRLVADIKFKYEWYAAYRILSDLGLLEDNKLSSFAKQMNIWFPNARIKCKDDAFGDYSTGHTGKKFELWNDEVFKKEKKKNQSITGFRKIYNICNELKFHLNPIPTLAPRQQ